MLVDQIHALLKEKLDKSLQLISLNQGLQTALNKGIFNLERQEQELRIKHPESSNNQISLMMMTDDNLRLIQSMAQLAQRHELARCQLNAEIDQISGLINLKMIQLRNERL